MCGIAGWVSTGKSVAPEVISKMTDRLFHRGPDDSGVYLADGVALGQRRLSIIDLAGGHQPMMSEDGRYVLIFNGQIYNYVELRKNLEARGVGFRTHSDTEVLLRLLVEEGDEALAKLNGMFSFALWDGMRQRLLLARDRLGVKPLYIMRGRDVIAFASELKAFFLFPGFDRTIDQAAVDDYLLLGYIRSPRSIFRAVRKLEPGAALSFENGKEQHWRWWQLQPRAARDIGLDTAAEELRGLLDDAVRLRMRSDVPIGAFLSGGIDSSAVTALMARHSGSTPVRTYSVGFGGDGFDELPYAREVARAFSTDHHEIEVSVQDALMRLPELMWHLDEPHGDTAVVPTYLVSQFAAQGLTVVLTGVGGDELFGGYSRYFDGRPLEHVYRQFPLSMRKRFLTPFIRQAHDLYGWRAEMCDMPLLERYLWHSAVFIGAPLERLRGQRISPEPFLLDGETEHIDGPNRLMLADLSAYLPDDILHITDRMSMAVSLEAREPLLDHRIVEFAARIPSRLKLRQIDRQWKICFKRAMQGILPEVVIDRPKHGFGSPIREWMERGLRATVAELFRESSSVRAGLVDEKGVQQYIARGDTYDEMRRDLRLWTLLTLEIWARVYLDGSGEKPSFGLQDLTSAPQFLQRAAAA